MDIKDQILVNKFGQGLISKEVILNHFGLFDSSEKHKFLDELSFLILQSKPINDDIDSSIAESGLKPTFTPCVILQKGVSYQNIKKIIELPEMEIDKSFILLIHLFKIAYQRRFFLEKNHPNKWWCWDLSNEETVRTIVNINLNFK